MFAEHFRKALVNPMIAVRLIAPGTWYLSTFGRSEVSGRLGINLLQPLYYEACKAISLTRQTWPVPIPLTNHGWYLSTFIDSPWCRISVPIFPERPGLRGFEPRHNHPAWPVSTLKLAARRLAGQVRTPKADQNQKQLFPESHAIRAL